MRLHADGKCLSVKEEGDSSHVNQAYDRFVAKGDKKQAANSLNFLRSVRYSIGTVIDQWAMVHVIFQCVKDTKPHTWINSFRA